MCCIISCSSRNYKKKLEFYKNQIEADEYAKNNALIRFYYRCNPDKLSDQEWCKRVAELQWILKYNGTLVKKENG